MVIGYFLMAADDLLYAKIVGRSESKHITIKDARSLLFKVLLWAKVG